MDDNLYKKLGNVLKELLNNTDSIDMMLLCDSFIRAFGTNMRNNNSKKISFQISDGEKIFSVDIDMSNPEQLIQSMSVHEDSK